jgi:peptide/nickel transport system permease protein
LLAGEPVTRYLAQRLLLLVPVLLGVSVVVFLVLHLSPGDPAEIMLGSQATKEDLARLRADLGLTEPLHIQYVRWLGHVARGDLGRSLWMKRPVLGEVLERLKATLVLTGTALLLSTAGGLALGIASATRPNSLLDRLSAVASLFGASMPVFWLGIVLMVVFSLWLGWLPASGMFAPYGGGDLRDLVLHLILPALTLGAASMTIIARLTRSTMLEVLGQDYIRTARAKGLVEGRVVVRHGLKNAMIPIVTVVGVQAGYLLGGAVLTETVFAWPGVGTLMVQGILARDFPLVQGCVLVIALSFVLINLAVDLLYGWLDPRIRYE